MDLRYLLLRLGLTSSGRELGDLLSFFIRLGLVTFTQMRSRVLIGLGGGVLRVDDSCLLSAYDLLLDRILELLTFLAEDVLEVTLVAGADL